MNRHIDLTGQKFGRLTVIKETRDKKGWLVWLCQCECGNLTKVPASALIRGRTKSCGCGKGRFTHGLSRGANGKHSPLYKIWIQMRQRCYNPKNKSYKDYGGRGITICEEWDNYEAFHNWAIANGYKRGLTIERINNNDSYSPSNCKWVPQSMQLKNIRNNRYITFNGITKTLADWGRITGINPRTISSRIDNGWPIEKALTEPVRREKHAVNQLKAI